MHPQKESSTAKKKTFTKTVKMVYKKQHKKTTLNFRYKSHHLAYIIQRQTEKDGRASSKRSPSAKERKRTKKILKQPVWNYNASGNEDGRHQNKLEE